MSKTIYKMNNVEDLADMGIDIKARLLNKQRSENNKHLRKVGNKLFSLNLTMKLIILYNIVVHRSNSSINNIFVVHYRVISLNCLLQRSVVFNSMLVSVECQKVLKS
jgi:hypothetical protein